MVQAVSITYFSVTALLIPSCLLVKKYSAKKFFPIVMILWGTIVMCISTVKSAGGLLTARFFLGIPESGVVPCCILYFSFWYKPVERAWRIGVFHSANALAGAVSGVLAVGIDHVS
jgi:MFS family permease